MKYLIINGSPHRGNTWNLAELVKADLQKLDIDCEVNEIHLSKMEIPFCCGCSNCFRQGYEKCPHYLKIEIIVKAIEQADGIIIASTACNMRETALLKNLFDHLCFYLHRPHFFKSKALILTTTGGVGGKSAAKSIASMLYGIGFNRCYLFSKASYSWNDYNPSEKTKEALGKKVQKFYNEVKSQRMHSPSCMLLIPYNLFRGMSLSYTKGSEFETKDGEYWTDDYRRKGVYDKSVYIPLYKRPFGYLFYFIGKYMGKQKKMLVTYKK
jgi:multimeric flavodoxin WrbA